MGDSKPLCYNPLCEGELTSEVGEDVEGYCRWECAVMARDGTADRLIRDGRAEA